MLTVWSNHNALHRGFPREQDGVMLKSLQERRIDFDIMANHRKPVIVRGWWRDKNGMVWKWVGTKPGWWFDRQRKEKILGDVPGIHLAKV